MKSKLFHLLRHSKGQLELTLLMTPSSQLKDACLTRVHTYVVQQHVLQLDTSIVMRRMPAVKDSQPGWGHNVDRRTSIIMGLKVLP